MEPTIDKTLSAASTDPLWANAKKALEKFKAALSEVRSIDPTSEQGRDALEKYAFLPNNLMISVNPDFEKWMKVAFDDSLGELETLRHHGGRFMDATPEVYRDVMKRLDAYEAKVQEYLNQLGPTSYAYKGFKITDKFRLGPEITQRVLGSIDYLLAFFKKRGVEKLLHEGIQEVILQDTGDAGALYDSSTQTIEIGHTVLISRQHRMLSEGFWLMGSFMHEFAHFVHMNYIKGEAKAFWDKTWDVVKQIKNKLEVVSAAELERFYNMLEKDGFNPSKTNRRLNSLEKVKFAYWLRNPGYGDPLITPKQLRPTKQGKKIFDLLRDPSKYVQDIYGHPPGTPDSDRLIEKVRKSKKQILGLGYSSGLRISPKIVNEMKKSDPVFNKDLEEAYKQLGVPTEYGKKDEYEDFADTFVIFMTNPEKLSENATYRMKRTLWLSGFGGKPVMRLAQRIAERYLGSLN